MIGKLFNHYDIGWLVVFNEALCPADTVRATILGTTPDSKVRGANMGPTWVLSAPAGPHVGSKNLAIRDVIVVKSLQLWMPGGNSLQAVGFPNEFSWCLILADGNSLLILCQILC